MYNILNVIYNHIILVPVCIGEDISKL